MVLGSGKEDGLVVSDFGILFSRFIGVLGVERVECGIWGGVVV